MATTRLSRSTHTRTPSSWCATRLVWWFADVCPGKQTTRCSVYSSSHEGSSATTRLSRSTRTRTPSSWCATRLVWWFADVCPGKQTTTRDKAYHQSSYEWRELGPGPSVEDLRTGSRCSRTYISSEQYWYPTRNSVPDSNRGHTSRWQLTLQHHYLLRVLQPKTPSASCTQVVDVPARKEILRRAGRCYVCLKGHHHLSKDCRSSIRCEDCRGRHHVTICHRRTASDSDSSTPAGSAQGTSNGSSPALARTPATTSAFCASTQNSVLLQTAQLNLSNPCSSQPNTVVRAIMDSGSQRTYILRDELHLPVVATESLRIKTFGNTANYDISYDVVQLSVKTEDHGTLNMTALVVPMICHPLTSQPINHSQEC